VANTSVKDLDANLVGLGRSNLDVFHGEGLPGAPRNRRLRSFSWHGSKMCLFILCASVDFSYLASDGLRTISYVRSNIRLKGRLTWPTVLAMVMM
jgi:hypothetical protein